MSSMTAEGWSAWPLETGGILLGVSMASAIVVTHIIGPGPSATHEPASFSPDADWQAAQVADVWRRDQAITYLGDWHTHPRGSSRFSEVDRQAALSIANFAAARQGEPVMVVLALGTDGSVVVGAAQLIDERLRSARVHVHPPSREATS